MTERIDQIGDDLERAARRDLRGHSARRRRVLTGAAVVALLVPSVAVAASLLTEEDVARSMPAGTRFLVGTTPACESVEEGVEYRCTIDEDFESEIADLTGTVEPTVDATKHVNGGCRSHDARGRTWSCYVGEEAVRQKIIGPDFLGEYAPAPGVG